jgi:molybdopterin converting factor small subunit
MEIDVKLSTRQSRKLLKTIEELSKEKKSMEELISMLMDTIKKQNENIAKQQKDNQRQIGELNKRIEYLELVNKHQEEIINARNRRLFGRKSEKLSSDEPAILAFQ